VAVSLVVPWCGLSGCSQPDNPKMPDVAPVKIEKDTTPPPTQGGQPQYGASKKYQDMMNK